MLEGNTAKVLIKCFKTYFIITNSVLLIIDNIALKLIVYDCRYVYWSYCSIESFHYGYSVFNAIFNIAGLH